MDIQMHGLDKLEDEYESEDQTLSKIKDKLAHTHSVAQTAS